MESPKERHRRAVRALCEALAAESRALKALDSARRVLDNAKREADLATIELAESRDWEDAIPV